MQFADIEMLDIPDDLSVTLTSQTASPSDSPKPAPETVPKSKDYPTVQKWLAGAELPFQFDEDAYIQSSKGTDEFSTAQTAYITRLYKIIEDVENVYRSLDYVDDADDTDPVGVVTSAKGFGSNRNRIYLESKLDEAFSMVVEAYGDFHDKVADMVLDDDADAYADLSALLDCIHANVFSPVRQKPEVIASWINRYDPRPDNATVDAVMYDTPVPYRHAMFWPYITELVTRGMFIQAVESLRSSGYGELADSCPQLHDAIEDLSTVLDTYTSMALKGQFAEWKLTVCGYRDNWSINDNERIEKSQSRETDEAEEENQTEDNKERDDVGNKADDTDKTNINDGINSDDGNDNVDKSLIIDPAKDNVQDVDYIFMAAQVRDVWRVLSGLPKSIAAAVSTWYDMYAALSLFQVRDADVFDDYYSVAVDAKGVGALRTEQAFCDVLSHRHMRVILAVDAYDSPTAAYVSRLYELKSLLHEYYEVESKPRNTEFMDLDKAGQDLADPRTLSDYLLTRHAYECLEVHLLVPVAVGLLIDIVPSLKTGPVLAQFFPHYQCHTNDDMEWALTVCAKLGLSKTVKTLYIKQGVQSMRHGHLYEAMSMLAQCYDDLPESLDAIRHIHHIAWEILFQDCLLNSAPVPDALVENVVTNNTDLDVNLVVRQCLAPYAVLAEYFRNLDHMSLESGKSGSVDHRTSVLLNAGLFSRNISRLFHLLRFKYLPQKFVPLLLAQFLPFFPGNKLTLPDLIVVIELLDAFELLAKGDPDIDDLYEFAIENTPENAADWRNVLKSQGVAIPQTVHLLVKDIREKIVTSIGQVYVK